MPWCKEHNKRGYAALQVGMLSFVKDRGTIDRRLDGKTGNIKKQHLRILTVEVEHSFVEFIKNTNKCPKGLSRKQATNLIIDVLKIREYCNTKNRGDRKFLILFDNAVKTGK